MNSLSSKINEMFGSNPKYVARRSDHIKDDIKRNWSSWNFGQDGFEGTEEELEQYKDEFIVRPTKDNPHPTLDMPFEISGFEFWDADEIESLDIRELYKNYWVLVDNLNAGGGLSGIEIESENFEEAKKEAMDGLYFGEGISFDAQDEYKLVWSDRNDEIHLFEIR